IMVRIFLVMLLGAGIFLGGAWYAGLLETGPGPGHVVPDTTPTVPSAAELGPDLYTADPYPVLPETQPPASIPIVLPGVMNPIDTEEVPSQVPGQILLIGDPVDDALVLAAGAGSFLVEPYSYAPVVGEKSFKFFRKHYDGKYVTEGQMLAMIQPAKAIADVEAKNAKVRLAMAEREAAIAGEAESLERYQRAIILYRKNPPAISKEDLGAARLTWEKLKGEMLAKIEGVKVAEVERKTALIDLSFFEIRGVQPFKLSQIKTVVKQTGTAVKQFDTLMVLQNLDRLQAEALIEEQYLAHLKNREVITATIEPTVIEKPHFEFPGHDREVTSVAFTRDGRIVSGSEDKAVYVWQVRRHAPLRKLAHEDAVRVVACVPPPLKDQKPGKNICAVGCANGDIYLWDIDAVDDEPKILRKAHEENAGISSLAFSPDGAFLASGASDGSIRIWSADGTEKYAFKPERGVAQSHEDAVTALHFTPQCKLISASRDKTLRVWQLKEKGASPEHKAIHFRHGTVPQLGVSNDGKWMLFDQGHTLKMLSIEKQTLRHTISVPANSTPFETVAIFSPDDSLLLTAGAGEGRLQLWRTPDDDSPRAFVVREFATRERLSVACAAFGPKAAQKGDATFAVSASGQKIYVWSIPTPDQVTAHRIPDVRMTLRNDSLDPATKQSRIGFEVQNPHGRFEPGRPVTIVINEP
ncbi:MAG: hypothetical protein HY289_06550, partial [Planctomycetes bacterium]|nr:hypothetical protein [Planctomycetota bacterium]